MADEITLVPDTAKTAISVTVANNKMAAFIRFPSDPPPTEKPPPETILTALHNNGVKYGINEEAMLQAIQNFKLDEDIQVAWGTPPIPGENARIEVKVNLETARTPKVGEDGRVDYKNIDFLQNAAEGTVLAIKHSATLGTPGMGVDGKEVSTPRGKDISLPAGNNTYVSPDKLQLIAKTNGSIVYAAKRIHIQPMSTIPGNVSVETGNIDAIGSLRVKGDIEAGYTVKVGGDLEVDGNVIDAIIECQGNILVKGGFIGQGKGSIQAQGDVTVKYVENQAIEAQGNVTVGEEALNARICSGNEIYFKSPRGRVVGGLLSARNLVCAKSAGNDAGTTTILRVGFDSELVGRYLAAKKEIERLDEDLKRVKEGLYVLIRQQMDGELPEAKKQVLAKLQEFQKSAPGQIEELKKQQVDMKKLIDENAKAKILIEGTAQPGVKLVFGLTYLQLDRREDSRVYTVDYGKVISSPYEPGR